MYQNLLFELADGVATVTVNRPKALNALNSETVSELDLLVRDLSKRKDVKVVILTGAGEKAFVAGADIAEMANMSSIEARELCVTAQRAFLGLEALPQIVIAAVNGYALGGGCELSMACDIRIASETAQFGQPEVTLGILPGFGGTQRLSRLVGRGRAIELITTADRIDANEAYRIGLVNKVVPKEELTPACLEIAKKIMSRGMFAVSAAKSAVHLCSDADLRSATRMEADLFGFCFSTDDQKEGMKAFLEKRPAVFKDF